MKNRAWGKLNDGVIEYADCMIDNVANPPDSTYVAHGYKRVSTAQPTEPAPTGYHYEADGWDETDTTITRKWKTVEDAPVYRQFSKLKIYGAIVSLPDSNGTSAWDKVKTWLEGKTIEGINGWMAFQLAQDISEDHPLFAALAEEARQLLGLTQEQFETLLDQCVLEG